MSQRPARSSEDWRGGTGTAHQNLPDAAGGTPLRDDPVPKLEVGTEICVRNRFLGDWTSGFQVAEVLLDGYRIRRLSDGHAFPDLFTHDEVRLERRQYPPQGTGAPHRDRRH